MVWMETKGVSSTNGKLAPLPPMKLTSTKMISASSITNQEIAMFWKQKRLIKEDHLLAAIKSAARVRARKMTEVDYRYFEESLKKDDDDDDDDVLFITERHTVVKDWWTKSKYAYLNQPAIDQDQLINDNPKLDQDQLINYNPKPNCLASSYVPNSCKYNGVSPSLCITKLGIF